MLFAGISAALLITTAAAQDDPNKQYGAKELYFRSRQLPYHAAPSDPAPPPPAKVEATPKPTTTTKAPTKTKVSSTTKSTPSTTTTTSSSTPTSSSSTSLPDGGQVMRVSAPAPAQGTPLGLRYSILRRMSGQMVEVPKDTEFHTGDAIQIKVQTNSPGYLYIVNQGSSGQWMPMFPSAEFQDGDNKVDGWNTYTLPPRPMVFDEKVGVEKLTVLFAREPETDFEKLIYSLQGGSRAKPASQKGSETPKPSSSSESKTLMASARIGDDVVRTKQQMYSRDLVIETVTPNTPTPQGEQKEYAEYVVNPSGSADSRVVAGLKLVHR
jgi:hypothetical protein